VKINRIALMTVAALSISTIAIAAEKDGEQSLVDAANRAAVIAPMSDAVVMKRPAALPALYVTFAAMQAWDVYSTSRAVKAGASESNPVAAPFVGNPGSMIGLKVMSTVSAIYFTERMWKTNPVKAMLVLAAINGATAMVSMNNMRNARAASARR
jgi:hypothetical protein